MKFIKISMIVGLFVFVISSAAQAQNIRVYDAKDIVKVPNVHNVEFAIKQHLELEVKLLQWRLTEPLRDIHRDIHRIPNSLPSINHAPRASMPSSIEDKVREWKIIECQRFGRCE